MPRQARLAALNHAITRSSNARVIDDFLFWDQWERCPTPGLGAALRVKQLRRAHPAIARAIRDELDMPMSCPPSPRELEACA